MPCSITDSQTADLPVASTVELANWKLGSRLWQTLEDTKREAVSLEGRHLMFCQLPRGPVILGVTFFACVFDAGLRKTRICQTISR